MGQQRQRGTPTCPVLSVVQPHGSRGAGNGAVHGAEDGAAERPLNRIIEIERTASATRASANCPSSVRELFSTCSIWEQNGGREALGFIGTCSFWLVCV